jgi:hypothetical protein
VTTILGSESDDASRLAVPATQRRAVGQFAARLNSLAESANEASGSVTQPTRELVSTDYRELNNTMQTGLNRVRAAAAGAPMREAGCQPPARLVRVLVAHAFY